jgi:hypothetical protein
MKAIPPRRRRERQARRGFRGQRVATVASYGPNSARASKVAVGIVPGADADPVAFERWYSGDTDVRGARAIGRRLLASLAGHRVRSVVLSPGVIGCPREEGMDYPRGAGCPWCAFWRGKDRWAERSGLVTARLAASMTAPATVHRRLTPVEPTSAGGRPEVAADPRAARPETCRSAARRARGAPSSPR